MEGEGKVVYPLIVRGADGKVRYVEMEERPEREVYGVQKVMRLPGEMDDWGRA